MTTNHVFEVI